MLTDRGSNVAGQAANSIIVGKPDFDPEIGKFRLKDGKLVLESVIKLKNSAGNDLNGLPNPVGMGASGGTAYDLTGVVDNGASGFAVKTLPLTNSVDRNRLYFVKLK